MTILQPLIRLLEVMKNDSDLKRWWKSSQSFFIFAEGWDDRPELLREYGELLLGSISFKLNVTLQVGNFLLVFVTKWFSGFSVLSIEVRFFQVR